MCRPDQHAIFVSLDGDKNSQGCKDGDLGLTNPSYNSGFIRICTADKNGNPLPADDIYGTIQHEISHAFGIGHSNIPGELMCSAEFYGETCPANLSPDNAKSDNFMFATMFKMCGTNGFQGCGQNAFSGSRYEVGETVGGSPNFQNDLSVDAHNLINKYPILKDPACAADRNCSPPRFGQTLSTLNACSIVHTCPSVNQLKQGYNQQCDGDTQCEGLTNLDYFQQGVPGSLLRASTITPTTAANQTTITPTSPTLNATSPTSPTLNATSPTSPTLNATSPSPPPTSSAKNNNSNILSNCPDGSPPAADGTCPAPSISNPTQPCIDNPALGLTCPSAPLPPKPVTCPDGSHTGC